MRGQVLTREQFLHLFKADGYGEWVITGGRRMRGESKSLGQSITDAYFNERMFWVALRLGGGHKEINVPIEQVQFVKRWPWRINIVEGLKDTSGPTFLELVNFSRLNAQLATQKAREEVNKKKKEA